MEFIKFFLAKSTKLSNLCNCDSARGRVTASGGKTMEISIRNSNIHLIIIRYVVILRKI